MSSAPHKADTTLAIAHAAPDQVPAIAALIERGFAAFVAPGTTPAGCAIFRAVASGESITHRLAAGDICLAATQGDRVVGFLEMTRRDHIILLFVEQALHRRGIARRLLEATVPHCRGSAITVNATPGAIAVYQALGFIPLGTIETKDGITFLPMALTLDR